MVSSAQQCVKIRAMLKVKREKKLKMSINYIWITINHRTQLA